MTPHLASILILLCAGTVPAQLAPPAALPVGASPDAAVLAHLDGDGQLDLAVAVATPDRVAVLPGRGDGTFDEAVGVLTGNGTDPHTPAALDVDGDGDLDLAVSLAGAAAVRVLLQDGGAFVPGDTIPVGAGPRTLLAGDLDGAGPTDLVSVDRNVNRVTVMLATGGGQYAPTARPVGLDPRGGDLADVDGDGDLDLLVSSYAARRIDVLLNDGDGDLTLDAPLSLGPLLYPEAVVASDLDGDGDTDVAASAFGNVQKVVAVSLQRPDGFGPFSSHPTGGSHPFSMALVDVDMDGDDDALVTNTFNNTLATLSNDGNGALTLSDTVLTGLGPCHVAVGDVDGNGSDDAVVSNGSAQSAAVLLNLNVGASPFVDLGQALAGTTAPVLAATGTLEPGSLATWTLRLAPPASTSYLVLGLGELDAPFKGGVMVPSVDVVVPTLTSPQGLQVSTAMIPISLPSGSRAIVQHWIPDVGAPFGFASSNAVQGIVP